MGIDFLGCHGMVYGNTRLAKALWSSSVYGKALFGDESWGWFARLTTDQQLQFVTRVECEGEIFAKTNGVKKVRYPGYKNTAAMAPPSDSSASRELASFGAQGISDSPSLGELYSAAERTQMHAGPLSRRYPGILGGVERRGAGPPRSTHSSSNSGWPSISSSGSSSSSSSSCSTRRPSRFGSSTSSSSSARSAGDDNRADLDRAAAIIGFGTAEFQTLAEACALVVAQGFASSAQAAEIIAAQRAAVRRRIEGVLESVEFRIQTFIQLRRRVTVDQIVKFPLTGPDLADCTFFELTAEARMQWSKRSDALLEELRTTEHHASTGAAADVAPTPSASLGGAPLPQGGDTSTQGSPSSWCSMTSRSTTPD